MQFYDIKVKEAALAIRRRRRQARPFGKMLMQGCYSYDLGPFAFPQYGMIDNLVRHLYRHNRWGGVQPPGRLFWQRKDGAGNSRRNS
jgi:hypothetical protein